MPNDGMAGLEQQVSIVVLWVRVDLGVWCVYYPELFVLVSWGACTRKWLREFGRR